GERPVGFGDVTVPDLRRLVDVAIGVDDGHHEPPLVDIAADIRISTDTASKPKPSSSLACWRGWAMTSAHASRSSPCGNQSGRSRGGGSSVTNSFSSMP